MATQATQITKEQILAALETASGDQKKAAKSLGLSANALYMQRMVHGIRLTPGRKIASAAPANGATVPPPKKDSGFFRAATPTAPRSPVRVELSPNGTMVFEGSAADVAVVVQSVGNIR